MKYSAKRWKFNTMAGILFVAVLACEDKIDPALENAAPVLVVDAWLNNKAEPQVITLTLTQPYFDNTSPPGVSGAVVMVNDDKGKSYLFVEDDKTPGSYVWTSASEVFGTVGNKYFLSIQVNTQTFQASSFMGRVPLIDSITFETEKQIGSTDSLTWGEFWSTDPEGRGDAYWIRAHKNGVLLNKPAEINLAYDAGFSAGGEMDGVTFITPLRRGINPNDLDEDGNFISPFKEGDSVNVELHSISRAASNYLNEVRIQTNRPGGFSELFSTPLANVSTNISNANSQGSSVLGFFNVAAVSTKGKRYKK